MKDREWIGPNMFRGWFTPGFNPNEHSTGKWRQVMDDTEALLQDRAKTHGDYAMHADLTQNLKNALHMAPNWPTLNAMQREALEMIAHKIGRVLAGNPNFKDHWMDISGYAMLIAARCPA